MLSWISWRIGPDVLPDGFTARPVQEHDRCFRCPACGGEAWARFVSFGVDVRIEWRCIEPTCDSYGSQWARLEPRRAGRRITSYLVYAALRAISVGGLVRLARLVRSLIPRDCGSIRGMVL